MDILDLQETTADQGPDNSLRLKTGWTLPIPIRTKFKTGIISRGSKEYFKDYVDLDYGGFLEISSFFLNNLSLEFIYMNDLKSNNVRVHANSINLSHMTFTRNSLFFSVLGYNFDITDESAYKAQKLLAMFYWDKTLVTGSGPSGNITLYYKKMQELDDYAIVRFIHADDITLPGEPNIYTDSSYTQLVTYEYIDIRETERISLSEITPSRRTLNGLYVKSTTVESFAISQRPPSMT